MILSIIIGFCFATGVFAEKIEVPDFTGMNYYEEIRNNSAYADLHIRINDSVESDTYKEGEVYDQSPSPHVKIRPKEEITLYIPKSRENIEVPDVYTYTFTDAITLIEGAGFKYQMEYEKDSGAPEKTVIRTDPERYTWAAKGSTVILHVAAASDTVAVPKLVGYDLQTARELAQSVGLDIEVTEEENSSENKDVVLRMNYREESQVPKGTVIGVVVSNGKPTESTAKVSFRLPNTDDDAPMKVYLGSELLSDKSKTLHLDGSTYEFEVTGNEEGKKLTVKLSDQTYYECLIDFTQTPAKVTSEKTLEYVPGGGVDVVSGRGPYPSVEGVTYDEACDMLHAAGFNNIKRNDIATDDPGKAEMVTQQMPPYKILGRQNFSTEIVLSVYTYEE